MMGYVQDCGTARSIGAMIRIEAGRGGRLRFFAGRVDVDLFMGGRVLDWLQHCPACCEEAVNCA